MSAFTQRIINAISQWFDRLKTRKPVRKKFIVERISKNGHDPDVRNQKTFFVENIERGEQPQSNSNRVGKFSVAGKTRPKQCPVCRTQNDIIRQTDRQWLCRTCNYKW